jgi:hypothetical protein
MPIGVLSSVVQRQAGELLTVPSSSVVGSIGNEVHPEVTQPLRVRQGPGQIMWLERDHPALVIALGWPPHRSSRSGQPRRKELERPQRLGLLLTREIDTLS